MMEIDSLINLGNEMATLFPDRQKEISSTVEQLQSGRFRVAFVGGFSNGKSYLINRLLGIDLLGCGVGADTKAIVEISNSIDKKLTAVDLGNSKEYDFEMLKELTSLKYQESSDKYKNIELVRITSPEFEKLPAYIELADTPGINDTGHFGERITYGYLAYCDAIVLVISCDGVKSYDFDFLKNEIVRHKPNKIIIAANKYDMYDEEANVIEGQIRKDINAIGDFDICIVSAKTGFGVEHMWKAITDKLDKDSAFVQVCKHKVGFFNSILKLEKEKCEFELKTLEQNQIENNEMLQKLHNDIKDITEKNKVLEQKLKDKMTTSKTEIMSYSEGIFESIDADIDNMEKINRHSFADVIAKGLYRINQKIQDEFPNSNAIKYTMGSLDKTIWFISDNKDTVSWLFGAADTIISKYTKIPASIVAKFGDLFIDKIDNPKELAKKEIACVKNEKRDELDKMCNQIIANFETYNSDHVQAMRQNVETIQRLIDEKNNNSENIQKIKENIISRAETIDGIFEKLEKL